MLSGTDAKSRHSPKPTPKKSDTGTSTDGSASSSQYARTMSCRWMATLLRGAMVSHQRRTVPAPRWSTRVSVSPGARRRKSWLPPDVSRLE
jgi:hypothetical protein